jgi:23S rRNA (cytosine1962-C5)-methyltransferase
MSLAPHLLLPLPEWEAYALLDSGDGRKLERFGSVHLIRPEPKAWWAPQNDAKLWKKADALYEES